jgi:hypothetical protein
MAVSTTPSERASAERALDGGGAEGAHSPRHSRSHPCIGPRARPAACGSAQLTRNGCARRCRHGKKSAAQGAKDVAGCAPEKKPVHIAFAVRPSMLSTEHPDNNYRGFVNVIIILLIMANMRIVIQVRGYKHALTPPSGSHTPCDGACLRFCTGSCGRCSARV